MLSAAHRTQTDADKNHYRLEPYVMAGDTYSAPPYAGQGGWSWYTGSAAWLHRAALAAALLLTACSTPETISAPVSER